MNLSPNKKIGLLALAVFALDQCSKLLAVNYLGLNRESLVVINGFFKIVHFGNTGAAWSMFSGNNEMLTIVALLALLILFLVRHRFPIETRPGWMAMGLMFGGIAGNLLDRMLPSRHHVIDIFYFYIRRGGNGEPGAELSYPAFNVADSAICIGVFLLFLLSFRKEAEAPASPPETPGDAKRPA